MAKRKREIEEFEEEEKIATREEMKEEAIKLMKKLDIYKPYINGFKNKDWVCFFENFGGYHPMDIYNSDRDIKKVVDQLVDGTYTKGQDRELFRSLYNSLLNTQSTDKADRYFILKDFRSYAEAQRRVEAAYRDEKRWAKMALLNTACSGKFTSDRTIQEYVDEIWHLDKVIVKK